MSIGLIRGTVAVEPHRVEWEISAQRVIAQLKAVLGDDLIDAQHIGSTAVRSICAKPIVDVAAGVGSFERMMRHRDALREQGIRYRREDHPGQHLFVCGDAENRFQTHYIHAVIWGQAEWNRYLNLRDYLNSHPDRAQEYSALKQRLAARYPEDRAAYTDGKSALIAELLCCADQWRAQQTGETGANSPT